MSEGPTTVRCPFCRYPYPMTRLQLDVYKGRSMGCMGCGKSFPVVAPPEPPERPPPEPLAGDVGLDAGDPRVHADGFTSPPSAAYGPGPDPSHTAPAAGGAGASPAPAPSNPYGVPPAPHSPAAARRPADPSPLVARLGVAAAVLFVALAAATAVVGYASAPDAAIRTAAQSHTPMWLLRAATASAAVAVVLGLIGLWVVRRQTPHPVSRRIRSGPAVAAVGLGLSELLLAGLLGLLALPPLTRGLAVGHQATCKTNLQQLGAALAAHASARPDGRFPDALADLVRGGQLKADLLVCPAHADAEPAPPAATNAEQADQIAAGRHATYAYHGKGWSAKPAGGSVGGGSGGGRRASTHTVVAHEPPGLHGDPDSLHVLFADGVVAYVEKAQAAKLLGELQAGQNPPLTAQVVRP